MIKPPTVNLVILEVALKQLGLAAGELQLWGRLNYKNDLQSNATRISWRFIQIVLPSRA